MSVMCKCVQKKVPREDQKRLEEEVKVIAAITD